MTEEQSRWVRDQKKESKKNLFLSHRPVFLRILFLLLLLSLLQGWLLRQFTDLPFLYVCIAPFVALKIFATVLYYSEKNSRADYARRYKAYLIPKFLKEVAPGIEYRSGKGISLKLFQGLGLFVTPPTEYRSCDHFSGSYHGVELQFSFVHSRIPADTKGSTMNQFCGIVMLLDFNKHFSGRVYLLPDKAEKLFGNAGRHLQKVGNRRHTKLIRLDDAEFEKAFVIYASDDAEARYILSHSFMAKLLALRRKFGTGLRVAFRNSYICLAIPLNDQPFDPSLRKAPGDEGQIRTIKNRIQMLLNVVNDLDLKNRIWSKE